MTMWRVHPDRNPGEWAYCVDPDCAEEHHDYIPFYGVKP